jgi:Ca2+-binding RTX toxin-like protein
VGRAGDDFLIGGSGDDWLFGGAGADYLSGGAGYDSVSYRDASAGVVVDLDDIGLNTGEAAGDGYASVEQFLGSAFNDRMMGGAASDALLGGNGDDVLNGRAGDDVLQGGDGNDLLLGGLGADEMYSGSGLDRFRWTELAEAGAGDVLVDFASGLDLLVLDAADFGAGLTPGLMAGDRLVNGAAATQAHGQFVYDGRVLWWDADGTGAGEAVALATFLNTATLAASDFDFM